ncbi:TIGR01777 family oxidoreductase [Costertonia aggregata]|uniref:TIGR01777 family protein n=1 Tax=Costertonia aggregata TaxID=343403 RepID=A0A7H9ARF8_9FLAO|nr:TIGR01777 family oxidoreductase [Costertonia aggregata]QLG45996.1 TIGR01777 family protein [Costertonia aggregata]
MQKLVIAGGSGFLGNAIITYFEDKFDTIIVLTRGKSCTKANVRYVTWDAKSLSDWQHEIDGCEVLINMAGRSVDCRYTEQNKKMILDSRVDATQILGEAITKAKNPPKIWLNSSTATIYKHSLHEKMSEENGEIGSGFSVNVAKAWEKSLFESVTPKTRKIALRTSIVLGKNGGALTPIKKLAKFGLGGKQGDGNQKFSWIHVNDFVRSIDFIIQNNFINGPVNIVAPEPTTNAKLMQLVRRTVGVGFGLPAPKWLLEIGAVCIRTETELILKSRNVVPKKLLDAGFTFRYRTLKEALKETIG